MNIHFDRFLDAVRYVYEKTIGTNVSEAAEHAFFEKLGGSAKFVFDEYPPVEIEDFGKELATSGLIVLPFASCYFEYPFNGGYFGLFCLADGNSIILVSAGLWDGKTGASFPFRFDLTKLRDRLGSGEDYVPLSTREADQTTMDMREEQRTSIREMLTFVAMLSAKGVTKESVVQSDTVNERRKKKGKAPLPGYTIVRLAGLRRPTGAGTHASPRPHMRRGHVRSLSSGKSAIIRPHFVMADPGALPTYRVPKNAI